MSLMSFIPKYWWTTPIKPVDTGWRKKILYQPMSKLILTISRLLQDSSINGTINRISNHIRIALPMYMIEYNGIYSICPVLFNHPIIQYIYIHILYNIQILPITWQNKLSPISSPSFVHMISPAIHHCQRCTQRLTFKISWLFSHGMN